MQKAVAPMHRRSGCCARLQRLRQHAHSSNDLLRSAGPGACSQAAPSPQRVGRWDSRRRSSQAAGAASLTVSGAPSTRVLRLVAMSAAPHPRSSGMRCSMQASSPAANRVYILLEARFDHSHSLRRCRTVAQVASRAPRRAAAIRQRPAPRGADRKSRQPRTARSCWEERNGRCEPSTHVSGKRHQRTHPRAWRPAASTQRWTAVMSRLARVTQPPPGARTQSAAGLYLTESAVRIHASPSSISSSMWALASWLASAEWRQIPGWARLVLHH